MAKIELFVIFESDFSIPDGRTYRMGFNQFLELGVSVTHFYAVLENFRQPLCLLWWYTYMMMSSVCLVSKWNSDQLKGMSYTKWEAHHLRYGVTFLDYYVTKKRQSMRSPFSQAYETRLAKLNRLASNTTDKWNNRPWPNHGMLLLTARMCL